MAKDYFDTSIPVDIQPEKKSPDNIIKMPGITEPQTGGTTPMPEISSDKAVTPAKSGYSITINENTVIPEPEDKKEALSVAGNKDTKEKDTITVQSKTSDAVDAANNRVPLCELCVKLCVLCVKKKIKILDFLLYRQTLNNF